MIKLIIIIIILIVILNKCFISDFGKSNKSISNVIKSSSYTIDDDIKININNDVDNYTNGIVRVHSRGMLDNNDDITSANDNSNMTYYQLDT